MAADYIVQDSNNWEKESFLSARRGLHVSGTEKIQIAGVARYSSSTWTIMFSIKKLSASGNTYLEQPSGISIDDSILTDLEVGIGTHVAITSDSTIYYNGFPKSSIGGLGNLLNAQIDIGVGDFIIDNIIILNTVISDFEVKDSSDYIGVLHPDLWINCMGYWTCQDNNIRKVEAGDESINKGLSIGDLALFDNAQMFNIDRSTILVANHGKLINYTDESVGSINPSSATKLIDFYDNDNIYRYGSIVFSNISQTITFLNNTNWSTLEYKGTAILSLNIAQSRIDVIQIGTAYDIKIKNGSGVVITNINPNLNSGSVIIDIISGNNATLNGFTTAELKEGGGAYIKNLTNIPQLNQCLRMTNEQYVEYDKSVLPTALDSFTFFGSMYSTNDVSYITRISVLEFVIGLFDRNNGAGWINGQFGGAIRMGILKRASNSLRRSNYDTYLSSTTSEFTGTTRNKTFSCSKNIQHYTITYDASIQRASVYFNSKLVDTDININPTKDWQVIAPNDIVFRSGFLDYEITSGSQSCSSNWNDSYLITMGYAKRCWDGWEIKEIHNNNRLNDPFFWKNSQNKGFRDNLEILHHCNEGNIYWDGSNYRLKNYGTGADAIIGNFNEDTNDFVTDNPNAIAFLDSLR